MQCASIILHQLPSKSRYAIAVKQPKLTLISLCGLKDDLGAQNKSFGNGIMLDQQDWDVDLSIRHVSERALCQCCFQLTRQISRQSVLARMLNNVNSMFVIARRCKI